jgi:hypothetical protein
MTALHAVPAERRRAVRFKPAPGTVCRVTDGTSGCLWPAHIRDLSASNIGLLIGQPIDVGTLLALEILNPERACLVLAVCTRRERIAEGWVVGCEFAMPLPAEAVSSFRHGAGHD